MSAWMFDHAGISRVVYAIQYGGQHGHPTPITHLMRNSIGAALLEMNAESLRQRYGTPKAESIADAGGSNYKYREPRDGARRLPSEPQSFKTLDCYLYQCCEGDVSTTRPLFKEITALRDWYGARLGYHVAPNGGAAFRDGATAAAYAAAAWG